MTIIIVLCVLLIENRTLKSCSISNYLVYMHVLYLHSFCFVFIVYAVVNQFYQTRVIDEYVLLGNAVVLKCLVPSFVADFIQIFGWVDESGNNIGSSVDKSGTPRFETIGNL